MALDFNPLKDYLVNNIVTSKSSIDNEEPLFSSGLVDSFGILDLLFYIKEQFGVSIEDFELVDNNIDTFSQLTEMIQSRADA